MASGTHIQMEVNAYIKYWISQSIPPDENVDDYVITDSIPDSSDSVDSESQNQNDDVEVIEVLEDSEMQPANSESETSDPKETDNNVYIDIQNFTNSAPNVFVVANFTFPSSDIQHVVLPISPEYDSVHSKESNAGISEQDASREPKPYLIDLDMVKSHQSNFAVQPGGDTPCITLDSESDTELYEIVDQASISNKTRSASPESDAVSSTTYPHSSSGDHYSSDTEISQYKKGNRFHPYEKKSRKKKVKDIRNDLVKKIEARYKKLLEFGARRLYRLYPKAWKGSLLLKNMKSNVEIKILNGDAIVANMCLLKVNNEVCIRVLQKARWTSESKLYIDLKCLNDQILMLILPEKDQPGSFNNLRGIGGYLQKTQSAGYVVTENISGVHFAVMFYPKNYETMSALKRLDKEAHTLLLNEYFMFGIVKLLK